MKHEDENGFVTYEDVLISKEGIFEYSGKQIDFDGSLKLDPNKIYEVYRPKSEVCSKSFVDSLENKPLVNDHTMIGEGFTPAEEKGVDGVLTDVRSDDATGTLYGNLTVYSSSMKDDIRGGKRELSLGYRCSYRPERGVFNGKSYDFVQYGLCANHIALVDMARMGHDCRVMDSANACDSLEIPMEATKEDEAKKPTVDELIEGLKGCSDEDLAKVRDFLAKDGEESKKDDAGEESNKEGNDAGEDPEKDKTDKDKASAKEDEQKKDEVESAKDDEEEQKKDDESGACDSAVIAKNAVEEFKKASALAERAKALGIGNISMDGLFTETDVAKKICAMDARFKDVQPGSELATLNGALLMGCKAKKEFTVSQDSASVPTFDFNAAFNARK